MEYISLDEEDFRCLVRGGVVKYDDRISFCLKDIGFTIMYDATSNAQVVLEEAYKDHIKEKK